MGRLLPLVVTLIIIFVSETVDCTLFIRLAARNLWDTGGDSGTIDPYAEFKVDERHIYRVPTIDDTLNPNWSDVIEVNGGRTLFIDVWDNDPANPDDLVSWVGISIAGLHEIQNNEYRRYQLRENKGTLLIRRCCSSDWSSCDYFKPSDN